MDTKDISECGEGPIAMNNGQNGQGIYLGFVLIEYLESRWLISVQGLPAVSEKCAEGKSLGITDQLKAKLFVGGVALSVT
jgi:hypothetical protein